MNSKLNNLNLNPLNYCLPTHHAIADSGCTGIYIPETTPCINKISTHPSNAVQVHVPNGATMHSTHTATLPIPTLPPQAGKAHVFNDLKSGPLLSIGQLCDFGCSVLFTLTQMLVFNKNLQHIVTGTRNQNTGLWYAPFQFQILLNRQINHFLSQFLN